VEGASGDTSCTSCRRTCFVRLGLTHTAPDRVTASFRAARNLTKRQGGTYHIRPAVDKAYKWRRRVRIDRGGSGEVWVGAARAGVLEAETLDRCSLARTSSGEATGYGIGFFLTTDSWATAGCSMGAARLAGTAVFGLDRDSRLVVTILTNLTDAPLEPAGRSSGVRPGGGIPWSVIRG